MMAEDYFDEVVADVREAQEREPDVVLPWSWWEEQAQRHGMSPNAIYTRAVKVGLYTPPNKRVKEENGETEAVTPATREADDTPSMTRTSERETAPLRTSRPAPTARNDAPAPVNGSRRQGFASPGCFGEAIHGFASLLEKSAGLEQKVEDLTNALEQTQNENRRLRRAMREMDDLVEQLHRIHRDALYPKE